MPSTAFATVMSLPRKVGERQVDWYFDEIICCERTVGDLGVEITDQKIRDAIKTRTQSVGFRRKCTS